MECQAKISTWIRAQILFNFVFFSNKPVPKSLLFHYGVCHDMVLRNKSLRFLSELQNPTALSRKHFLE